MEPLTSSRSHLPILEATLDRRCLLALGVAGLAACATDGEPPPTSGVLDASLEPDAGATAAPDASAALDAGDAPDASAAPDAEVPRDSGASDAGAEPDSGAIDDAGADPDSGAVDAGPPPDGFVAIGPIANFPVNRWSSQGAANRAFIVGRDAAGIFIYSALCTHSGCLVPPPAGPGRNSVCPCHLSEFDDQGARLSGPARGPLTHRAAFITGGTLYVHPTRTVPATDRTPVP